MNFVKKAILLGVPILVVGLKLMGQSDYSIAGKVDGLKEGDQVFLANYFGNKLYYNDTAIVDSKGKFLFDGKLPEEQGKYAFVIPGPKYFDFIVAGEDIYFETDTNLRVPDVRFIKSTNNQVLFDYIRFIDGMRIKRSPWDSVVQDSTLSDAQKESAINNIKALNEEVLDYQDDLVSNNGHRLVGKYLNMLRDIDVVDEVPDGMDSARYRYDWYKAHFWDHCDLSDNRIVRDQTFHRLLDKYINTVIPQIPDSVCVEAKRLIDRVEGKDDLFKYIVHFITYNAEASKLMCMDKVFVYMVDQYFATGRVDWMDEEKLKEVVDRANEKRKVLCNEPFPNIILPDTSGHWISALSLDAKYTIVVIWESTCGHCKKELPKLMKLYNDWKDYGVKIYAIGNDYEREPWMKFIREKELDGWTHVSDDPAIGNDNPDTVRYVILNELTNFESLNFRKTLDIKSTPVIYVLDEEKKIIAKKLGAEQIHDLLVVFEGYDPTAEKKEHENSEQVEDVKEIQKKKTKDKSNAWKKKSRSE